MAPFKLSQKNRNPSTLPSMHNPWILLSGLLIFLGNIPYIVSILRKETVPNRASWWIWATVNLLVLSSYVSMGNTAAIGIGIGGLIGQVIIAILSIRFGSGGVSRLDRTCILGAIVSALLWWLTSSALTAHILGIFMDFLGWLPTFQKTRVRPRSENLPAWIFWTVGAGLSLFAIDAWTVSSALFILYIFVSNTIVLCILLHDRFVRRTS